MKKFLFLVSVVLFTIIGYAQKNSCTCCSEKYTEFDFWVGEWEVTNAKGGKAGENKIEKIQDDCILRENWTSSNKGYTGTSNNFYNKQTGQWEQIWIDNQGASLHLKGEKIGNQMILKSEVLTNSNGKSYFHRITWTDNEDGTVRQLWETITNDKEVLVAFDGLYKRK